MGFHQLSPQQRRGSFAADRPWLNPPKYNDEMPVTLAMMMFDGADATEVCRALGIGRTSFYKYIKEQPEFAAAYELGLTWAEGKHHEIARANLTNADFNSILWQMIGRNRFRMAEHRTVELPNFADAKNYADKMQILNQALSKGEITPVEFNQISSGLGTQARVEEVTELKAIIEKLETKLNQRK